MQQYRNIKLFSGTSTRYLAEKIAESYGIALGEVTVSHFNDGEFQPSIDETVRGCDVFIIQSTNAPTDNLFELLLLIDAAKRASAHYFTAVIPYFGFARQDRKDKPRVAIGAKLVANLLTAAGATRIMTMDLHAPQIQGFFQVPVDDLYAMPVLCEAIKQKKLDNLVVVSPDSGFAKKARKYAAYLGRCGFAIGDKVRRDHREEAEVMDIIGEVKGKTALIVDDFTISGGTLISVAHGLIEMGANEVYAVVTHGVFSEGSMEKISNSPLTKLLVTDTVETQPTELCDKIEVVSVAPLFAEAIRRIHNRESISVLFPEGA
jgi:ribose-phosphate pyrophosphokinase